MSEWRLDIEKWPGPDRKKWPHLKDVITPSPDGKHVAVVYAYGEVGIGKEVGLFALLSGPKETPLLLLRPSGLKCLVRYSGATVQWLGNRLCIVTPYDIRQRWNGKSESYSGTLYFDVECRQVAYVPSIPGMIFDEITPNLPDNLDWKPWKRLSWWPKLWHKH